MLSRTSILLLSLQLCFAFGFCTAKADVFRWDNGELIPGTEGIELGPNAQLADLNLEFASLGGVDLTNADLWQVNLMGADLSGANLTSAVLGDVDLTDANLSDANLRRIQISGGVDSRNSLAGANMSGAILQDARISDVILSSRQLYSTASYQQKDLRGFSYVDDEFSGFRMNGWDLSGQDLTDANLTNAHLVNANLAGANLTRTSLIRTDLTNANLTGAILHRTGFSMMDLTNANLTGADLQGTVFDYGIFQGTDFSGLDLSQAGFIGGNLAGADLTDTNIQHAVFWTVSGVTLDQIYSTASYKQRNLQGIEMDSISLSGGDFQWQDLSSSVLCCDLTDVGFSNANLANAELSGNLTGAVFSDAIVVGTAFRSSVTAEQIYSTDSYKSKDLRGITLADQELTDWDLSGQNLANTHFQRVSFDNVDLSGANLSNAKLDTAIFNSDTTYDQWTKFPRFFNPRDAGLTEITSLPGDFDVDGKLSIDDLDDLLNCARWGSFCGNNDEMFDLNGDDQVDSADITTWVVDLQSSYIGDADLNGEFNSSDLILVFEAGQYEDDTDRNSTWATGDWNGDQEFTTSDLVFAFRGAGYEKGPRLLAVVPEPSCQILISMTCMAALTVLRRKRTLQPAGLSSAR